MKSRLACLSLIAIFGCGMFESSVAACSLSETDRAWVDRSMQAWNYASTEISGIGRVKRIEAVIFDSKCVLNSSTAMNGGPQVWRPEPHSGEIPLPDNETIPASVISFASDDGKVAYFTMSTPSVWREAVKSAAGLGSLELLMTAVLLHEATHVAQMPTYGAGIGRLAEQHKLPQDFNDDSIQKQFEGNAQFKESIGREVDLLLAAATARDRATALRLAAEARTAMKARQARWYTGKDAYLSAIEDLFLTMEGSGQWVAHQWLVDPRGGGADPRAAFGSFGWRGKWWSQNEGFALFMVLDRLAAGAWKKHAFGDGAKTVLEMLDEAIASSPN